MCKKIFSIIAVLSLLVVSLVGCNNSLKMEQEKSFFEKTVGTYEVPYEIDAGGGFGGYMGKNMINKYCDPKVKINFKNNICSFLYTMHSRKMEGLSLKINDDWIKAKEQDGSTDENIIYVLEFDKNLLKNNLEFQTYVSKMNKKVDFKLLIDSKKASKIESKIKE